MENRNDLTKKNFEPVEFDPFAGPEIIRVIPAIEPQLEIFLSCLLGGEDANRAYNESVSLLLKGKWNQEAMVSALGDLILRHEALRSAFNTDGTQICIYKAFPLNLIFENLSGKSIEDQQSFIRSFAKKDALTSFDLLKGPLFRFALFELDTETHYLTLTAHHIICDGWSIGIMLQDLQKLYADYSKGFVPVLPEAVPFSLYAEEQVGFLQSSVYLELENYWLERFRIPVSQLNIPIDFPRPTRRTYKSQRDDFKLDPDLLLTFKKTGARAGTSFVSTLLCAFEILLYRITGQDDIVLGLPAAGQSATGHHALVGHCVNLLPLRSSPNGSQGFLEYLRERKIEIFDDYDHQRFTFGSLLKKLNIPRDPSRIPLVPVVFNMDMGMDDGVSFEGLTHRLFYNPREYENFEISVNASGSPQEFVMEWSYNTQLFKPASIRRMMDEFEGLLRAIAADPEKPISDIPPVHNRQKTEIQDSVSYPKNKSIAVLFSEQAAKTPDSTALIFEDIQLSYRQLEERSNQLANYLKKKGVGPETLVPVCIERSADLITGILGILKAGGTYVPLDSEYPEDRIDFILRDTRASLVIYNSLNGQKLPGIKREQCILMDEDWKMISREPVSFPQSTTDGRSLAYIMYTSGSTGKPKGVMIENRNVVSLVRGVQYVNLNRNDVLLCTGSPSFDATSFEFWSMLLNGGKLVLCSEVTLLNVNLLIETIKRHKVSIMWFTSSLLNQWIDLDIHVFEGLKTVLAGGEKLSERHIQKLKSFYPSLEIINGYGPTENTTFSLTYFIRENHFKGTIPIGRPLSNRTAYILNQQQQPCAEGVIGELFLGGDGVGRGYLNNPVLTKEKFLPDPFSKESGAKMYRSGDLARILPDGNIEFHGRIDDQVKIRGFRIEPAEIEFVLQQFPGVQHAVVIATGEKDSDKRLVAYIVPVGEFNKEKISLFMQAKLPSYMVPRVYIPLNRIPLTSNGKVDKKALPNPDLLPEYGQRKIKFPETEAQKMVAAIWSESLRIPQISIDDNFFELGGHSLIAVRVMKSIEEKTHQHLPITALFESPTVEKLSRLLELDEKSISWKSLVPIKPGGNKPPLYIVHGSGLTVLIFHSLAMGLDPEQPVYGLQARGLNGIDEPFDNIQDIAAYYVSEIMEQNPQGPYSLAGYSFGGIVAFEMAKQFKALGREVNMLAIFDTNADNSVYFDSWSLRMGKKIKRQFPKFKFIVQSFLKYPADTIVYQFAIARNSIYRLLLNTGLIKTIPKEDLLEHADKINHYHDIAFKNYKMTPYNGTIDLFRVKSRMYFLDDPVYLGWKSFALQGLNIHEISGDHKTFLLSPNVQELSRLLREIINERNNGKEIRKDFVNPSSVLKAI